MANESLDRAPGDETLPDATREETIAGLRAYLLGFGLAILLTATSFWTVSTTLLWRPGVGVGLIVLAIAQMGVHLVFFLHITTAPDNTNNVLALAFGILIVFLVVAGSLWIMDHLNTRMMPPGRHAEPPHAALYIPSLGSRSAPAP
jgi:cytochrome o ubiquinol oxidase operon protein cyoD